MTALFLILGFLILLLSGAPVVLALALPAIVYFLWSGFPLLTPAHAFTYALDSFPLLAVPLFILVGNLMNTSGITTRLFGFASVVVSHRTGGLAQVNIVSSLIFAGKSGAALADIGSIGSMLIKAMTDAGYRRDFSAALTAASATLGPLFPPSIPLIIYAAVAETSAVRLLLGGIVPAICTAIALMVLTAYLAARRSYPVSETRASGDEVYRTLKAASPALMTPFVLILGMLSGVFTATEAAAVTVVYILFINTFIYRDFKWKSLILASTETVRTTTVLMVIVAAAALFTRVLALEGVPQAATRFLLSVSSEPMVLLLIVNILLLVVGMFLESISALVLLVPIIAPPLVAAGVDPLHLGVVVVYNLMLGLITPPMGMSLYLVSDISKCAPEKILVQLVPYYIPLFVVLALITYFPKISLWIPSLL